jgi:hypothetical protein
MRKTFHSMSDDDFNFRSVVTKDNIIAMRVSWKYWKNLNNVSQIDLLPFSV